MDHTLDTFKSSHCNKLNTYFELQWLIIIMYFKNKFRIKKKSLFFLMGNYYKKNSDIMFCFYLKKFKKSIVDKIYRIIS